MYVKVIISDLEKWDAPASPMSKTDSVESKQEAIYFLVRLSSVNIWGVSASLTKGRRTFLLHVSDYVSQGDVHCSGRVSFYHESRRASHFVSHHESGRASFYHKSVRVSYFIYREMSIRMAHLRFISPLKTRFQLGRTVATTDLALFFPCSYHFFPFFWRGSLKSCGDEA
jgi:hypothetical protein